MSLLQQVANYTAYPVELGTKLGQVLADRQPDYTTTITTDLDYTTVTVQPGWYTVNTVGLSSGMLVLAGTVTGMDETAMTNGGIQLDGTSITNQPIDSQPTKTRSLFNLLDSGIQLFDANPSKDWRLLYGVIDTLDGNKYTANADFAMQPPTGGSGLVAFCMDQNVIMADGASYMSESGFVNDRIRTVLWYGYNGPQSIFRSDMFTNAYVNASAADQRWATHLLVAAFYTGRNPATPGWGKYLPDARVVQIPGYRELYAKAQNHKLPYNVHFDLHIYFARKGSHYANYNNANGDLLWGGILDRDDGPGAYKTQPFVAWEYHASTLNISTQYVNMSNMTYAGNEQIQDKIYITAAKVNGKGYGWKKGEQLFVQSILKFSADGDGTAEVEKGKAQIYSNPVDLQIGQTLMIAGSKFTPSDFGMTAWHAGKYWFDVLISTHMTDHGNGKWTGDGQKRAASLDFDIKKYGGYHDTKESFTVTKPTLTGSTQADASLAKAGNTESVSDKINLSLKGSGGWTLKDTNVVLHYKAANGSTVSKTQTIPSITIPANGSTTVTSPMFTPDMLFTSKQWEDGDYWFTIIIDGKNVTNTSSKVNIGTSLTLDGTKDTKEQFTLKTTIIETPDGVTEAHIV